jgi:glucan 1,3-beta-glucosidase
MTDEVLPGVNLGGWLVLEKWITNSLFAGTSAVDEYTYCLDADSVHLDRLKNFRDSYVTKKDFTWLAQHGVRVIRLPVGYWLFGDEPPFQGTVAYVDRAFAWAEETNLKILLDLHGVRGSQNGHDHSGRSGSTAWHRDKDNMSQSLRVIEKLAERYGKSRALLGISLLNEPHPIILKSEILGFYEQAYEVIRHICGEETWVVYSDGYLPSRWRKELPRNTFKNVYIDTHHYQIFTPLDRILPPQLSLLRTRWQLPWKVKRLQRYHPVIVGEWSLSLNENPLRGKSQEQRKEIALAYATEQLKTFAKTKAWFFWTYKTEDGGNWSFLDCVEKGLLTI